jgi:hypothetical protein
MFASSQNDERKKLQSIKFKKDKKLNIKKQ